MKYFKSIFFLLAIGVLFSCKKFLDTKPTDFLAPETYYSNADELNAGLIGVYDALSYETTYGNNLFANLTIATDEAFWNRSAQTTGTQVYNFDYSNAEIAGLWATLYQGIERANVLIANINKPKMDETERAAILGQALFLRGYYHFLLVSNFGGVPLKIAQQGSVSQVDIARTPAKEVYAQVLKDMTDAEAMLMPASAYTNSSRISKTAAQGILARVCLTMAGEPINDASKYAEALSWAKKIEASNEHQLRTSFDANLTNSAYSQIFINLSQDIYDIKESMWEASFSGNRISDAFLEAGRLGNTVGIQFTLETPDSVGYSYGFVNVTKRQFLRYGNGDLRRDWAIAPFRYNTSSPFARVNWTAAQIYNRNVGKFRRSFEKLFPKNKNYTPINFPILRYADVLLMLAEAENEVTGPTNIAYDALNKVRRRAYGVNINASNAQADAPSGLSKTEFRTFIQEERARELCFEALRKADLIRWGIFTTTMSSIGSEIATDATNPSFKFGGLAGTNVAPKHLLFPIPSAEMSVNKAITAADQNPGW